MTRRGALRTWAAAFGLAGTSLACSSGGHTDASDARAPAPDAAMHVKDAAAKDVHDAGPSPDATRPDAHDAAVDAPLATTLSISPQTLVPSFSPSVHDYYVRCGAGANSTTVTMTAAPGSTIALAEPVKGPSGVSESSTFDVMEGQAIVVDVTAGGTEDAYWIRCLPHDFPQLLMTPHADAGAPTPGYYLVGDVVLPANEGGYAVVLDVNGVPVWYHATPTGPGAVNLDSLSPDTLSFVPNLNDTYASVSGQYEVMNLKKGTTLSLESVGVPLDMHELRLLTNGDYLVIADPILRGVDLTGLAAFGPEEDMVSCRIQELSPAGKMIWEWDALAHFDPVKDSTWPQTYTVDGKIVVDPFHCNSIDVDANGDLLVSARHMDSVFLVSKKTGDVVWKLGGASFTKDTTQILTVIDDPMTTFHRQHDVRWVDGGISMFDDETETPGPARAVVYALDLGAGTATEIWDYAGTSTSLAMGSFRIEPDGSRIIGWGVGLGVLGPKNRAFTELDPHGNDVLDFGFPDGDDSYRAVKIPITAFDIALLRATSGAP